MADSKIRYIQKAKAGIEDIATGDVALSQTRNGTSVTVTPINASNIAYSGDAATEDFVSIQTQVETINQGNVAYTADVGTPAGTVNVDATGDLATNKVSTDDIEEKTTDAGVTIDGVLIKDNDITTTGDATFGTVDATAVNATTVNVTDVVVDNEVQTDIIAEETADAGVTIDGVLVKDNDVTATDLIANTQVQTDTVIEKTADAGVTIDGLVVKDSRVVEYEQTEIVSKENGVQLLENGAIYTFDDWDGVSGFLTGSNGYVVPYKPALSNVFTGFEVRGWHGISGPNAGAFIDTFYGLNWFKNRDTVGTNLLASFITGSNYWWASNTTAAQVRSNSLFRYMERVSKGLIELGDGTALNDIGDSIISWNWSYPLARAWHANGGTSRKVPTPWGIVDSVESNASSGLTGDQVVLELYNPLTGNGCLLYIGTGVARTFDISGGIAPDFMVVKDLSVIQNAATFHRQFNGGTNPGRYGMTLASTAGEVLSSTTWNDTEPTSTTIDVEAGTNVNTAGELYIVYYFASVAGLQAFGGYAGNAGSNNQATGCKNGMAFAKIRLGGANGWLVVDALRGNNAVLQLNSTAVESAAGSTTVFEVDSSSGLNLNSSLVGLNASGDDHIYGHFGEEMVIQGDIDVYPTTAVTSTGSNDTVTLLVEANTSATLNTEFNFYASRESSPNWVKGTLTKIADLSESYQLLQAEVDISGNAAGTALRWRFETDESGSETEHNIRKVRILYR